MANDASSGVGNSSAQTVDAHVPREWEGPASEALREGWSEAEVCAEKLPLRGDSALSALEGAAAAASGSSCELANPAQVRQIASQTGVLPRRMRFVAGRGYCSSKSPRARILVLGTSGAHWPARWPRFELTERVAKSQLSGY